MVPVEWLNNLLASRALGAPDGRPLYQYRLTSDEYTALRKMLKLSAVLTIDHIITMKKWDAVFVMYAAEWWRTEYAGSWSWEGIFGSLGVAYQDLPVNQRNVLIENGLRYWRRSLRLSGDRRRLFLGTVATEGGLPLNQLDRNGGWLYSVLTSAVEDNIKTGIEVGHLIDNVSHLIPANYRGAEVKQILVDIGEAVVALRLDHQLMTKDNPVGWLDEHEPAWRQKFPLPVEDAALGALLGELVVKVSSTAVGKAAEHPFKLDRLLLNVDTGKAEMIARLVMPSFVPLDNLGIDVVTDTLLSVLDINIKEPGGQTWRLGRGFVTTYRGKRSLKILGNTFIARDTDATQEMTVCFTVNGATLYEVAVYAGGVLDDQIPWLFTQIGGEWLLQGTASCAVTPSEAIAYVPKTLQIDNAVEQAICGSVFDGQLIKFSGELKCSDGSDRYVLTTGTWDKSTSYQLEGLRVEGKTSPNEVYRGFPQLWMTDLDTGRREKISNDSLLMKAATPAAKWGSLTGNDIGLFDIKLTDEQGLTIFRKRIGVLNSTFKYTLLPSRKSAKEGDIRFDGLDSFDQFCKSEDFQHQFMKNEDALVMRLVANSSPPMSVVLSLVAKGQKQHFSLQIPFPASGALLYDAEEKLVPFAQPLILSRLQGYRLKLYDPHFVPGRKVRLMLELRDADHANNNPDHLNISQSISLSSEISTFSLHNWAESIDRLFRTRASLRSTVRVSILSSGQELFRLTIRSFESTMTADFETGLISLSEESLRITHLDALETTRLEAFNLIHPEEAAIELESLSSQNTAIGVWKFDYEKCIEGPWLIFPAVDSTQNFMPFLWNVGNTSSEIELTPGLIVASLQRAIQIPDREIRAENLRARFDAMVDDYESEDWTFLFNFWDQTSHLPTHTFDLWIEAVRHVKFIAALYMHDLGGLIDKLEAELPLVWEVISFVDWTSALDSVKTRYQQQLADDSGAMSYLLASKISKIEGISPSMISIGMRLKERFPDAGAEKKAQSQVPKEAAKMLINEDFQNLLRRHANDENEGAWPSYLSNAISTRFEDLPSDFKDVLQIPYFYQRTVVKLPFVLAWQALSANESSWPHTPEDVFMIQEIRLFDEVWFNTAFNFMFGWMSEKK